MTEDSPEINPQPKRGGAFKTLGLVVVVAMATVVLTVWVMNVYLFPKAFKAVELSEKEQVTLDTKLKILNLDLNTLPGSKNKPAPTLAPQRYSEDGASRDIRFSERELNALIATNTDLASQVAIDLSPDLVSARILIPLDPDMPVMGGKTLKASAGLELSYKSGNPIVVLKGVSLWGVPIPNAWLGNIKNIDLVHEYGDEGFWKAFAAGVENIAVGEGHVTIQLKE